jgi:hypothetical protein
MSINTDNTVLKIDKLLLLLNKNFKSSPIRVQRGGANYSGWRVG